LKRWARESVVWRAIAPGGLCAPRSARRATSARRRRARNCLSQNASLRSACRSPVNPLRLSDRG
jgi:hypothetical protein